MLFRRLSKGIIFCCAMLFVTNQAHSSTVVFTERTSFENQLGSLIIDSYDQVLDIYQGSPFTDVAMSAAFGETIYFTTFYDNVNEVVDLDGDSDREYRSGDRYGSFELDFTSTSLTEEENGNDLGVFGVGFDIAWIDSKSAPTAYVTYGDNSNENFTLASSLAFWAITSSDYIQSVHFGNADGGIRKFTVGIDNLTIGGLSAVPLPAAVWLFGSALLGLFGVNRFGKRQSGR